MLTFPFKKQVRITEESESFKTVDYTKETELPIGNKHPGAFGYVRTKHTHEGVDLYCLPGEKVFAMEDGIVVHTEWFTGPNAEPPSEWWRNTRAVHVEGKSGVIVYGEIIEADGIEVGATVAQGQLLGKVETVLTKDKGRPMTMLHLELYEHGSRESVVWHPWLTEKPAFLKDPTNLLKDAMTNILS